MTLLEILPKNEFGEIVLAPGKSIAGEVHDATASPAWFAETFPDLAHATVPLADGQYAKLKAIDSYWAQNAERWRDEGLI